MADDEDAEDPAEAESTLVRSGLSALTFTEMGAFVRDLEARPPERLLGDLAGLMALPEAKYGLVAMVLRRKTRPGGAERAAIFERLGQLRSTADSPQVRKRAQDFLTRGD